MPLCVDTGTKLTVVCLAVHLKSRYLLLGIFTANRMFLSRVVFIKFRQKKLRKYCADNYVEWFLN